jgi:type II secretory pathway pseudopilin PulG
MTGHHEDEGPRPAQGTAPPTQAAPGCGPAAGQAGQPGYVPPATYGPPAYPPARAHASTRFPVWAIVLIVVAVLAIPAAVMTAVAIPMFMSQHDKASDSAAKEGGHRLLIAIQTWAVENGDVYPPADEVSVSGAVGRTMGTGGMSWPVNPWTDEPMAQGPERGDFTYTVTPDGTDYTLTVHLSDGGEYVLHDGPGS